ncbi:MAG: hypothetical protein Q9225_006978 [Loekoesia sp. 1 TL-2023]
MAQKPQKIPRLSRSLIKNRSAPASRRVAAVNTTSDGNSSKPTPSPSNFQFTQPIRKILEPPLIDKLRHTLGERLKPKYQHSGPPRGNILQLHSMDWDKLEVHYRPGRRIPRSDKRASTENPFRDIYYVPPESEIRLSPTSFLSRSFEHLSRDSNEDISAEPQIVFHRQDSPTLPYKNPALWRYLNKRSLSAGQQQKVSLSTSSIRHTPAPSSSPEPIDIDQYHRLADTYIDNLVAKLEAIQEERGNIDCEYSAGVLTLAYPPAGTYVLNKQPPNRQIWLSSPISGPKRYDYVATDPPETEESSAGGDGASRGGAGVEGQEKRGDWVYLRDGSTLSGLLREELGVELDDEVVR